MVVLLNLAPNNFSVDDDCENFPSDIVTECNAIALRHELTKLAAIIFAGSTDEQMTAILSNTRIVAERHNAEHTKRRQYHPLGFCLKILLRTLCLIGVGFHFASYVAQHRLWAVFLDCIQQHAYRDSKAGCHENANQKRIAAVCAARPVKDWRRIGFVHIRELEQLAA
jgi:hypothetical protein